MREFELRFKVDDEKILKERLQKLGFRNNGKYNMSDLAFESKDWVTGDKMRSGYLVVRIRLIPGKKPLLELKEMIDEDTWNETSVLAEDPRGLVEIMSKTMRPARIISKTREEFLGDDVIVVLDDVKHLGKFVEVEGDEEKVFDACSRLGFEISQKQDGYGMMLFRLEKEGKIKFNAHEMLDELKRFGY